MIRPSAQPRVARLRRRSLALLALVCAGSLAPSTPALAAEEPAAEHHHEAKVVKPVVYWDKPAGVVAFQLQQLSNAEFLLVDRVPADAKFLPYYQALLVRPGMNLGQRREGLSALTKLNKTSAAAELVAGVARLEGDDAAPVLADLLRMLASQKPADFAAIKPKLREHASEGGTDLAKSVGYLGLLMAGASDEAWKLAGEQDQGVVRLLQAIPMVPDAKVRAAQWDKLKPLAGDASDADKLKAAIAAIASVSGKDPELFALLGKHLLEGVEPAACASGLLKADAKRCPADLAPALLKKLLDDGEARALADRAGQEHLDAMQLGEALAAALPAADAAAARAALKGMSVRTIVLRTIPDNMLFDVLEIAVEAGKPVRILFDNNDVMPHNLVVVDKGAVEEVGEAAEAMQADPNPPNAHFVPKSEKVRWFLPLTQPGSKNAVAFVAPDQEGELEYVCTFPGHWRRMVGKISVVTDLAAWKPKGDALVAAAELDTVKANLSKLDAGRNYENARKQYSLLGCAQCHKLGKDGAAFGPDLTESFKRHKSDRLAILKEIYEPSALIAKGFEPWRVETVDGEAINGLIVKETAQELVIQTGAGPQLKRTIAKADIESRKPLPTSLMPLGLYKQFKTLEDALDLIALIEAGGDPKAKAFAK